MTVTLYQKHLDVTFTDANGKCEEFSTEKKLGINLRSFESRVCF